MASAKPTLHTVLVLGAAYAIYKMLGVLDSGADPGGDVSELDPSDYTWPDSHYILWADQLESALWGNVWTEDEAAIYSVMRQMRTNGDYEKLVKTYGTRCFWVDRWNCHTLPDSLVQLLSAGERQTINTLFARKGMTVTV